MNQEIDKEVIIAAARKHLPTLLIAMVVGMLLAFAFANFMLDKQYESTATVLVSNVDTAKYQSVTSTDLTAAKSMAATYRYIMISPRAQAMLRTELADDPDFDSAYLNAYSLSTSVVGETEIIRISVRCGNPDMAALVCNKMVDVSGVLIGEIFEGGKCNSLGPAEPNYSPSYPNVRNMMMIGALIGLAVAAAVILLVYLADNRVKDEADFVAKIGVPVLGEVPSIYAPEAGKEGYSYYADTKK